MFREMVFELDPFLRGMGLDDYFFLAVFAAARKSEALGAPLDPGRRMHSFEPAAMRARLRRMFSYSPGRLAAAT